MQNISIDNAKVMSKGQITIPKNIREILGLDTGDQVTLISQNNHVIMMNSATYALKVLQEAMQGEAEQVGLQSEHDVNDLIKDMRISTPVRLGK